MPSCTVRRTFFQDVATLTPPLVIGLNRQKQKLANLLSDEPIGFEEKVFFTKIYTFLSATSMYNVVAVGGWCLPHDNSRARYRRAKLWRQRKTNIAKLNSIFWCSDELVSAEGHGAAMSYDRAYEPWCSVHRWLRAACGVRHLADDQRRVVVIEVRQDQRLRTCCRDWPTYAAADLT